MEECKSITQEDIFVHAKPIANLCLESMKRELQFKTMNS